MTKAPGNQPLIGALKELGLTEYEAKLYLTLLANGPSRVKDLAFSAAVPRTKSYAAIRGLAVKNLVKLYDTPLKCSAQDVEEGFKEALAEEEARLRSMRTAIAKINRMKANSLRGRSLAEGKYYMYVAEESGRKLLELVSEARYSFHALVDGRGLAMLHECREALATLNMGDADIKVVVSYKDQEPLQEQLGLPISAKVGQVMEGRNVFIADGSSLLITNSSTGSALFLPIAEVAGFLDHTLFSPYWDSAVDLAQFMRLMNLNIGDELPSIKGDGSLYRAFLRTVMERMNEDEIRKLAVEFYERVAVTNPSEVFSMSPDAALPAWSELISLSLEGRGKVRYDSLTKMLTFEVAEPARVFPESLWLLAFIGYLERMGMPLRILQRVGSQGNQILQTKVSWSPIQ
ncbi:MAG TPA: helix-turn-helix domain-containing protein [Conexivisphaerales archaeon]|nr:helix-turn-helix domain-containing protein [Conexivisphaerales archaeon]